MDHKQWKTASKNVNAVCNSDAAAAMQREESARGPVVFGRRGFIGLCLYLLLLYGVTYVYLRPDGRPSVFVQLFTLVFYAIALLGIALHRRREPLPLGATVVEDRELRRVKLLFGLMLVSALVFSVPPLNAIVIVPIVLNFIIWSALGVMLTWVAFQDGLWERLGATVPAHRTSKD